MRIPSLLFTVFLFLSQLAAAQTSSGIGARAEGMGGAFVAVADDATAIYWNPAGLATGATFDFQVSWGLTPALSDPNGTVLAPQVSPLFVGAALPVLGAGFYRSHTVQGAPDRQNEGSGKVQIRTLTTRNVAVTVVQTVVSGLVIGTTARLVTGGVPAFDSRTTVDFDAGALVSAAGFRIGLTAKNLREPEFDAGTVPFALERQVRIGAALAPRSLPTGVHGPFSIAFDADLLSTLGIGGDVRMAALGGEYWLAQGRFGARAGVRWSTVGGANRAVSGGVTVRLPRSLFVEGQLTNPSTGGDNEWTVGLRATF